jgi:dihydropteroate synthase
MLDTPATMQDQPHYDDVVAQVLEAVTGAGRKALDAGAFPVWIDPGIGFGKTIEHNLTLLAHIDRFVETGLAVLVGVSRKGFAGRLHGSSDQRVPLAEAQPTATDDRLEASVAMAAWATALGVDVVRVHDVSATVQALQVVAAGIRP